MVDVTPSKHRRKALEEKAHVGAIVRDHVQAGPGPDKHAAEGETGSRGTSAADEAVHKHVERLQERLCCNRRR